MMPVATKWAKRIYNFPFVKSVNLSGSLAKNYFDNNSDIDFFIIAKTNRLWICRTLLILYWKIQPQKNKKFFCTNYFIDETLVEFEDQNRFTATELSYLIPIINSEYPVNLLSTNQWINEFINNKPLNLKHEISYKASFLKSFFEICLANKLGDLIENSILQKTIIRWRKKYPDMSNEDFELQFRSRKNVCKRHTKGFQNKVLQKLDEKIAIYEKHTQFILNNRHSN